MNVKILKALVVLNTLFSVGSAFASGGDPAVSSKIDDAADSWVGRATILQSQLDRYSAMSSNNILGTHNSYNSEEYADDGYIRYIDPQQKHNLREQLILGARFIELDVHWAINAKDYRYHLLLCHGQDGHEGCGPSDRFLTQGLDEIKDWLRKPSESSEQVLILYIEDHSDNKHSKLYDALNSKIGSYVYKSGGCKAIPNNLTKQDVLSAGKKVVVFKDGRSSADRCSSHDGLKNMVFTDLGDIDRVWEDRTILGGLFGGDKDSIEAADVRRIYKTAGTNIVNLDDMTYNDGRNEAAIWSWDKNQPDNYNNQDCALQWGNGRWDDGDCSKSFPYACNKTGTDEWQVTGYGPWTGGVNACSSLGAEYSFGVPSNSRSNEALKLAKGSYTHVWLNYHDRKQEGFWTVPQEKYLPIVQMRNNFCLDLHSANPNNGTNVRIWDCNGHAAQKWYHNPATGQIMSATYPNKCLDIPGNGSNMSNGTNVQIWDCGNGLDQKWTRDGNFFRNQANPNMVLDAQGGANERGDNVGVYEYRNNIYQSWR